MLEIIIAAFCLTIGAIAGYFWSQQQQKSLSADLLAAKASEAAALAQAAATRENLVREREASALAMTQMEQTFENLSNKVVSSGLSQLAHGQSQQLRAHDERLDLTLRPIETLLTQYRQTLNDYNQNHTGALVEVRNIADSLLATQERSIAETNRLNQLLGRADQRGHWGEIQLVNVLEASGLRENIDYDLQVTATSSQGRRLRPDCIVNMPGSATIVIDAKFPFDAFEAAMTAESTDLRREKYAEHAAALRNHVKALKDKSYWELAPASPEFVLCFVPSDFAITAAFEADAGLHAYAANSRVLIVGPTNLLSLLWSVAMVLRQHDATINAADILALAETLVERIRLVAEPASAMGRSLSDAIENYNKMVRSVETRLAPLSQSIQRLGAARTSKPLPDLDTLDATPHELNNARWSPPHEPRLFEQ